MISFTSASPGLYGPIGFPTGAVVGWTGEYVGGVTGAIGRLTGADVGGLTGARMGGSMGDKVGGLIGSGVVLMGAGVGGPGNPMVTLV